MNLWKYGVFLSLVFLIQPAFAGSYSTNGTLYYPSWNDPDNKTIPDYELDISSGKWPYLVQDNGTHMLFTVSGAQMDQFAIPKLNMTFDYQPFKVSPRLTYPKSVLLNNMVSVNATVAYLSFPYSLSRVKDWADEHNIYLGRWHFDNNMIVYDDNETVNYLPISAYELHVNVVSDDIRLYFLKSEANKLQGNITFQMQSWTINGSTSPAWINSSKDNITENGGNENYIINGNGADYFNRSNSTNPGINWNISGTGIQINSNKLNISSSAKVAIFLGYNGSGKNISFNVGTTDNNCISDPTRYWVVLFNRESNTTGLVDKGYNVRYDCGASTGTLKLNYLSGSSSTQIGSTINTNMSLGDYITIDASTVSTGLKLYKNGSLWETFSTGNSSYSSGYVGFYTGNSPGLENWTFDNFRIWNNISGVFTAWYNSGIGNEIYKIDINATGNYTIYYGNNSTRISSESQTYLTTNSKTWNNQSYIISGVKYQDAFTNITLLGNYTETPEIIQITFFDKAVAAGDFTPPTPTGCTSVNGTTWINVSCSAGVGNVTNGMNFTNVNTSAWSNGTAFYWNNTGLTPATSYTYHIYGFNSSGNGTLSLTFATLIDTTQATPTPTPPTPTPTPAGPGAAVEIPDISDIIVGSIIGSLLGSIVILGYIKKRIKCCYKDNKRDDKDE